MAKRGIDPNVRLRLIHRETITNESPMTAVEAVRMLRDLMVDLDREWFCVINLDADETPINYYIVSMGDITSAMASAMQTFKASLLCNARKIIAMHNHPSGNLEPSIADLKTTTRLTAAGRLLNIELMDHLIAGGGNGKIYSIGKRQELDIDRMPETELHEPKAPYYGKQYSLEDYTFESVEIRMSRDMMIPEMFQGKTIEDYNDARRIMHPVLMNQKMEDLIAMYLNNQGKPFAYQILPKRSCMFNSGIRKMLSQAILNNCNSLILFSKIKPLGAIPTGDKEFTRRIAGCAKLMEIDLEDHILTSEIGECYSLRSCERSLFTEDYSRKEIERLMSQEKSVKERDPENGYRAAVSVPDTLQRRKEKMEFGDIKHQLTGKLIPIQGNAEKLRNRPYKKLADFALVYGVEKDDGTIRGVDNKDLESMGMSEKEFVDKADAAIADNHPSFLFSMYDFMEVDKQPQDAMPGLYMATSNMFGAAVIGYPDFLDRASKIMGNNYYLIPSSVNEVLLLKEPYGQDLSASRLQKIVREVNGTLTAENILTDRAYHYSSAEKILESADEYEERQRTEEQDEDLPDESEMDDPDTIDQDIQASEMAEESMEDICDDYIEDY